MSSFLYNIASFLDPLNTQAPFRHKHTQISCPFSSCLFSSFPSEILAIFFLEMSPNYGPHSLSLCSCWGLTQSSTSVLTIFQQAFGGLNWDSCYASNMPFLFLSPFPSVGKTLPIYAYRKTHSFFKVHSKSHLLLEDFSDSFCSLAFPEARCTLFLPLYS